jgi:hypothetical protein
MAGPERLESRVSTHAVAGFLSVALHAGLLLLVVVSGGRLEGIHDAETPITRVVMLESRIADRRDGVELPPVELAVSAPTLADEPEPRPTKPPVPPRPDAAELTELVLESQPVPMLTPVATAVVRTSEPQATLVMPEAEAAALLQRIERLAEEHAAAPRARVTWDQDGRQYDAEFVQERARNGVELDRIVAEVSAEDRGMRLRTRIMLKRLPFSHYTQVVDRWDPTVQMHDDEVVGRTHINSRFNVLHDSQAMPRIVGKVSTAARGVNLQSDGRGRESAMFRQRLRTDAGRIELPRRADSAEWARRDADARVHELAEDAWIEFFGDGSYAWSLRKSSEREYRDGADGQAVYFIAAPGAKVHVQGRVAGRFLVYSPQKIIVEGSLRYAHDPREHRDSGDYLGLVCDKDIEVASPGVTGPGDLHIQAALYAKRRFVVTDIDHRRSATLHIYGSLAAGSLTATEPRYATRIEYDERFERQRPPGFPSTDRVSAERWDGRWTERPEQAVAQEQI